MTVENSDILAWLGQAFDDPRGVDAALQALEPEELHEAAVMVITFTALLLKAQQTQGNRLIESLRATLDNPEAHMQAYRDWLERVPLGHTGMSWVVGQVEGARDDRQHRISRGLVRQVVRPASRTPSSRSPAAPRRAFA